MRLRRGKSCGRGAWPNGISESLRPRAAISAASAGVLRRIDLVDAAGLHGDGAGGERGAVGGGVDAAGEAGGDHEAVCAEVGGEPRGHAAAERRGVAGADQRHRRPRGERRRRRAPRGRAAGRRWWRAAADSPAAPRRAAGSRPPQPPAIPPRRRRGRRARSRATPAAAAIAGRAASAVGGAAVLADEPDERRRADPARAGEPQPVEAGRFGAGQGLGRDLGRGGRGHRRKVSRASVNARYTPDLAPGTGGQVDSGACQSTASRPTTAGWTATSRIRACGSG